MHSYIEYIYIYIYLLIIYIYIYIFYIYMFTHYISMYIYNQFIGLVGRVFANVQEMCVQFQVESYQRLKKWYLVPSCLTLSIIWYISRVMEQSRERSSTLPTPCCSSYSKGSLRVALDYSHQLYLIFYTYFYTYSYMIYIYIYTQILLNI